MRALNVWQSCPDTGVSMSTNPSRRNGAHLTLTPSTEPAAPACPSSVLDLTNPANWMSYSEVCELFGESRHTLNKWRKREGLGFPAARVKPNGHLMFRREEIAAFLNTLAVAA